MGRANDPAPHPLPDRAAGTVGRSQVRETRRFGESWMKKTPVARSFLASPGRRGRRGLVPRNPAGYVAPRAFLRDESRGGRVVLAGARVRTRPPLPEGEARVRDSSPEGDRR